MVRRKLQKQSIVYKLTFFVVLIVIAQAALLTIFMIGGGVLQRAEENAYQSFFEKVSNRNSYIQREMKNRWTNIDPYVAEISTQLSEDSSSEHYFEAVMDNLIDMLRTTQATGAFIILERESESSPILPSFYIRDYDPLLNDYSNGDLYMLLGPSGIAKSHKMPLDEYWHYGLSQTQALNDFYLKPYQNAALSTHSKLLGYWSKPFQLYESDVPIITYTMPLYDDNKKLRGIIGIEIKVSYLAQYLPATDLQQKDSLGYMLAYKNMPNQLLNPIFTHGALQKRMLITDEPLQLEALDKDQSIYTLSQHNSKEPIYACVSQIGLFAENSPFKNEEWYLIGLMPESSLLSYVNRIKQILLASILSAAILGSLGGILISYRLSKPILKLAKQVRDSEKELPIQLNSTGLIEVDELSKAMEMANNALLDSASRMSRIIDLVSEPIGAFEMHDDTNRLFVTDQLWRILGADESGIMSSPNQQAAFIALIDSILACPEPDEDNIYRIESEVNKWVKIKLRRHETITLGVVIDVSSSMLEKKELLKDRDLDPLTKLWNRKAFQWRFENWQHTELHGTAALLMFDLDNLKMINDSYGHKWGDHYIQLCAKTLQTLADPKKMMLARRSGDEFAMLLYDFPDKDTIRQLIEQFYTNLANVMIEFPNGTSKPLMVSAGVAWLDNPSASYDEVLHLADEALYDSKRNRKGSYTEARTST